MPVKTIVKRRLLLILFFLPLNFSCSGEEESRSASRTNSTASSSCENVNCSGEGSCELVNGSAACRCNTGFRASGLSCIEESSEGGCAGVSCSGHGSCVLIGDAPSCNCDMGFTAAGLSCVAASTDAPRIISFSSNITEMSQSSTLVLTAIVTDPNGIDDLIGGTLEDVATGATYGSFSTSAAEGSYEISLSWSELRAVQEIDTEMGGINRIFEAVFYDQAGNEVRETKSIALVCASDTSFALCGGSCADLNNSSRDCGACGVAVPECNNGVSSFPLSPCLGTACSSIRQEHGVLEVFHEDSWAGVCDDDFTDEVALVACRQLGYSGLNATFTDLSIRGEEHNGFWLDEISCTGDESRLDDCSHDAWGFNDCRNGEYVYVSCE